MPEIIKNLIFVHCFTCDNIFSIEFDPLGFSVEDLHTKRTLMRSESTRDLYHVTSPTCFCCSICLASTYRSPQSSSLQATYDNRFLSCSNNKFHSLYGSCQLEKHVKLPFSLSNSVFNSPFDIIHSDV